MGIQDNMLQIQVEKMHRSKSRSLFSTGETSPSPDGMAVGKRVPRCHVQLSSTHPVSVCAFLALRSELWAPRGSRGGRLGPDGSSVQTFCQRVWKSLAGVVSNRADFAVAPSVCGRRCPGSGSTQRGKGKAFVSLRS